MFLNTLKNLTEIQFKNKSDQKLFEAISMDNIQALKEAISEGADVNFLRTKGFLSKDMVPLYEVMINNNLHSNPQCFEYLLKYGANPNYEDKNGISLLMRASGAETWGENYSNAINSNYVKLLIKYGADVNKKSKSGYTALDYAMEGKGLGDTVDILLENDAIVSSNTIKCIKNAIKNNNVDYINAMKVLKSKRFKILDLSTILIATIFNETDDVVKLIKNKNYKENELAHVMYFAILNDNTDILKALSESGFKLNTKFWFEDSAIVFAAKHNKINCLNYMRGNIKEDFKVNGFNSKCSLAQALLAESYDTSLSLLNHECFEDYKRSDLVLSWAIDGKNPKTINFVLDNFDFNSIGGNINDKIRISVNSAIASNNLDMVKYFIDKGFDINSASKNGTFPIERAALLSDLDTIKFLVEKLGAKTNIGKPLSEACSKNRTEIIKYLVSKGANVNEATEHLPSPLEYAIRFGNVEVIKLLIENGAQISDRDISDAEKQGCTRILEYLKAHRS